jgi:hypothetical protein
MGEARTVTAPPGPEDAVFTLGITGDGWFFNRTDTELTLTAEGVRYAFEGRSGLRAYSGLASIRLQRMSPEPSWAALVELRFARRPALVVYSLAADGKRSPGRDRDFTDFVAILHRRLTAADRSGITFRRGVSPMRNAFVYFGAMLFAALSLLCLVFVGIGWATFFEALWPGVVFGMFAAGFFKIARMTRPGSYDPLDLPPDLLKHGDHGS